MTKKTFLSTPHGMVRMNGTMVCTCGRTTTPHDLEFDSAGYLVRVVCAGNGGCHRVMLSVDAE